MIRVLTRVLACWRLTELVVADEVTRPAREWVTRRWPESKIAYLANCSRCVSVWAGLVVIALPEWLTEALALSAANITLSDWREARAQAATQARMAAAHGVRQGEAG